MKIESIVKVMNFHALLRVEAARKQAEKFFEYEKELNNFADIILNNRNLVLDKKTLKLDKKAKPLNIYIANDLGFCGNFNSNVNRVMEKDKESQKIIIGKKILKNDKDVLLAITKEEYSNRTNEIENILYDSIFHNKNSEMNIIYNHYHNISQIELVKKKILPVDNTKKEKTVYKDDFVIEGNINEMLINIIVLYLSYEIKVAQENSYASENVMRQMITKQSIDKLKEIKEEEQQIQRNIYKQKNVKEILESGLVKKMIEEDITISIKTD